MNSPHGGQGDVKELNTKVPGIKIKKSAGLKVESLKVESRNRNTAEIYAHLPV
jgi:hypothetical protein